MTRGDVIFIVGFCLVAAIGYDILSDATTRLEPIQEPWTELELDCAEFVGQTERGDQYHPREILRMCRTYIQINGEFGDRSQ